MLSNGLTRGENNFIAYLDPEKGLIRDVHPFERPRIPVLEALVSSFDPILYWDPTDASLPEPDRLGLEYFHPRSFHGGIQLLANVEVWSPFAALVAPFLIVGAESTGIHP